VSPRLAQRAKVVLACGEGLALSSLYSLFGNVRVVLCRYVTEVAEPKRDGDCNLGISAGGDAPQDTYARVG